MKTCNNIFLFLTIASSTVVMCSESPQPTKKNSYNKELTNKKRSSDDDTQKAIVLTSLLHALMHNEVTITNNQILCFPHYKTSSEALLNKLTFIEFKKNVTEIFKYFQTTEHSMIDQSPDRKQDLQNALVQFDTFRSGTDLSNLSDKKKNKLQQNRSILLTSLQQGGFDEVQSALQLLVHYSDGDKLTKEKHKRCIIQ